MEQLPSPQPQYKKPKCLTGDHVPKIIQELEKGRESVHHMRTLYLERQGSSSDHHHANSTHRTKFDEHFSVALSSFESAMTAFQRCAVPTMEDSYKSEESGGETPRNATSKDKRGCYKRRRTGESVTIEIPNLTDDGYAWRKYGQKVILNSNHPRNYYRCTHKIDQGCQATKQVQQISENPTNYMIVYHGQHTCQNPHKNPQVLLDCSEQNDSSVYLSFESHTPTSKHTLNSPFFVSASQSSPFNMVKQEYYGAVKEEVQSVEPHDRDQDHDAAGMQRYSSASPPSSVDHQSLSTSLDQTATGPSSCEQGGDVISASPDELLYNTSSHQFFDEADYGYGQFMMSGNDDIGEVLQEMFLRR